LTMDGKRKPSHRSIGPFALVPLAHARKFKPAYNKERSIEGVGVKR
jgi:hypothetical protein